MHNISILRVGGIAKSNFHIFRKICGDKSLKNVVIVTNQWSKLTEDEGMRRVAQLASMDDYFKAALEKKARMMHHTRDTVESVHEVIRAIIENHPVPLIIQEELVTENKPINETGAGQEVDKKIAMLVAEYEKKIKEQLDAAEEARKLKDEETRQEQLEEKAKNEEKLNRIRDENAKHAEQYRVLQSQMRAVEESNKRIAAEAAAEKLRWENQLAAQLAAQRITPQARVAPAARRPAQPAVRRPAPVTYHAITSGKKYSLWNTGYKKFATLDRDEKYSQCPFDQPWIETDNFRSHCQGLL